MRAKEPFEVSRCLTRRVLGNNRTTTKHNSTMALSSLVHKFGLLLARGFAQMAFLCGLVVQAQLRAAPRKTRLALNWLSLHAAGAHSGA